MIESPTYIIGDIAFSLSGRELCATVGSLNGFGVFSSKEKREPDFRIREEQLSFPKKGTLLYKSEADGVVFSLSALEKEGGYFLSMHKKGDGSAMCLLCSPRQKEAVVSGDFTPQMLRFALWVGYGIMSAEKGRIAVHGSSVVKDGKAYLFLGESGTGKSTHSRLWIENIPEVSLLNDDSPIITANGDTIMLYGSPWSGKTPCYRQECFPLGGCARLSQAPANRISKLSRLMAYAAFHPSCPPEFAKDASLYESECRVIDKVAGNIPFFHLECLPDKEAALLSFNALSSKGE